MKIPIDVEVQCSDGPAGHTAAIIIDPAARQVTHIVVKGKGALLGEFLVPLAMIDQCTPYSVILRWSREKLAAAPRFDKAMSVDADGISADDMSADDMSTDDTLMYPYAGVNDINFGAPAPSSFVQVEQVPGSGVAVHLGAHVDASDGRVGKVDEFVVNRDTGAIVYLVLRHGHLWKKEEIAVPISEVDHIADDIVYLKLDKAGVEALPALKGG
jgi:sporulation protein YlmC with PRC-barrel domain